MGLGVTEDVGPECDEAGWDTVGSAVNLGLTPAGRELVEANEFVGSGKTIDGEPAKLVVRDITELVGLVIGVEIKKGVCEWGNEYVEGMLDAGPMVEHIVAEPIASRENTNKRRNNDRVR